MSTSESCVTMMMGTGLRFRICWQIDPRLVGQHHVEEDHIGCTRWNRRSASCPSPALGEPSRVRPDARAWR